MSPGKVRRKRGYTRLSGKRQITLPLQIVTEIGLTPGDELRVEALEGRIILSREESLEARRLRALEEVAGTMAHVYQSGYLDSLRDEWR